MIYLFLFILLIMASVDVLYPFYSRKYIQFGISIPEPFVNEEKLAYNRSKYSFISFLVHLVIILSFFVTSFSKTEDQLVLSFFFTMIIMGLFSFTLYSIFYISTKKLVFKEKWFEKVTIVHVTKFESRLKEKLFEPFLFIGPVIITMVVIMITLQRYDTIPDVIATHWRLDGQADAWAEKTYASVLMLPLMLIILQCINFAIAFGVSKASVQITAQESEQSIAREVESRRQTSYFLAVMNIAMTSLLLILHISTTLFTIENTSFFIILTIVYLLVTSISVFIYARKVYKMKEEFLNISTDESITSDDHLWKWGLFYFNKDDPSILIEKRVGIGWTLNFARLGTYIFLFLVIFLPLLPLFFL